MTPRILILGGGVGGTIVANRLARRLRPAEAEVVVVDATGQHVYQPGLLYLPFDHGKPEKLLRPERRLLDRRVQFVQGAATAIDLRLHAVQVDNTSIEFDWLVLATGSRLVPERVRGLSEAHHFYDMQGAVRLREALGAFKGGRIVVGPTRKVYKCPPAPLEFTLLLDDYLRRRHLREQTEVHYIYPLPEIFPAEEIAMIAEPLFKARGIMTTTNFNVKEVGDHSIRSHEGQEIAFDLAVLIPPHRIAPAIEAAGLAPEGWVKADRHTLRVEGTDRVFALGDVTDLDLPKTGAVAHFQAATVVEGILSDVRGTGNARPYDGSALCLIETGAGRGITMHFDYEHPARPPHPSRVYHWAKEFLNRTYWMTIPSGRI